MVKPLTKIKMQPGFWALYEHSENTEQFCVRSVKSNFSVGRSVTRERPVPIQQLPSELSYRTWAIFGDSFKKITLKVLISCVGLKRRLLRKVSEKFLISHFIAVTIHIPLPKSHTNHDPSEAPAAIAHEAPEGTYLLPVTEHKDSPPAINLAVNLRLLLEKG